MSISIFKKIETIYFEDTLYKEEIGIFLCGHLVFQVKFQTQLCRHCLHVNINVQNSIYLFTCGEFITLVRFYIHTPVITHIGHGIATSAGEVIYSSVKSSETIGTKRIAGREF